MYRYPSLMTCRICLKKNVSSSVRICAIDVRVGHDDDAVVEQFAGVECLAVASAERGNQRANLLECQDLVFAGALDVQDFAFERQDGLERSHPTLLRAATGRITLDQENLALAGVLFGAVSQFAW